jgi:colanic acid/amylovoran biosynthesis glycosyltransferase
MKEINVCIVVGTHPTYSETFIHTHIQAFNARVLVLSQYPTLSEYRMLIATGSKKEKGGKVKKLYYNYIAKARAEKNIRAFFISNSINVVLAEYGVTAARIMPICKKFKMPMVVHFHGYDAYHKDTLRKYSFLYKELFEYASSIIAVSKHMKQQLIQLGAPEPKIQHIVYGIDVNKFNHANPGRSGPILTAVGRMVEKKAPYLLILAFMKALEQVPEAKLKIAGDGELSDVCKKMVQAFGLEQSVNLLGAVDHNKVAELMQHSRAFVQHSVTPANGDSEGTPVAILEAGAIGLPVISTKHAGIPDVVVHGTTGFLVEEGDINEMAKYMVTLLTNPYLAQQMGNEASSYVRAHLTVEKSIDKLKQVLLSVVSKEPAF